MQPQSLEYESYAADARGLNELPTHDGESRSKSAEFFASPPPEIGKVISAESTVPMGQRPWSLAARCALAVTTGVVAVAMFIAEPILRHSGQDELEGGILFGITAGIGGLCAVFYVTRVKGECTFIGTHGIGRFKRSSLFGFATLPVGEVLVFERAVELRAEQTRHVAMGAVYTGSLFDYAWFDGAGKRIYRIRGGYHAKKPVPAKEGAWHFARGAEFAWSRYFLSQAEQDLKRTGTIAFRVDSTRLIHIGQGFLEFHFGGTPVRLMRAEIASVSLNDGQFTFKDSDAKWYSRAGKYSFSYGRMANAKVFLMAMESLMGYRWG